MTLGKQRMSHPRKCFGFTLVELLVVIAIISVLIAMSLPAMQNMREMSRRSNCEQNLVNLSLAMSAYSLKHVRYPTGTFNQTGPIVNEPVGYHQNWVSGLLPFIDAGNVFDAIDFEFGVYDPVNELPRNLRLPRLICPSASGGRMYTTNYAGIYASTETPIDQDSDGVFILNRGFSEEEIPDGLGYTMFLAEKLSPYDEDLGWMSGTRSSLRNTGHPINADRNRVYGPVNQREPVAATYVGGIASDHPGGANVLLGGGEIQFRSQSTDLTILQQMAARNDGQIPIEWQSDQTPVDQIRGNQNEADAQ